MEDKKDILERDKSGEPISIDDPDYKIINDIVREAQKITAQLNTGTHSMEEIREIFSKLIGKKVDNTFRMNTPFHTDFGKNIIIGKNVFFNFGCTFMDRGGIYIGDNVMVGPNVNLITINHNENPYDRSTTISKPIIIKDRVWIGAGAIVLAGVTIGENSIIGAGTVVTHDIPDNSLAVGNPAKVIRKIKF